jgi:hypothetical protein
MKMEFYTGNPENPQSRGYWISELESLGIRSEKLNELNDVYEVKNLVENMKQTLFQDYKSSYQDNVVV